MRFTWDDTVFLTKLLMERNSWWGYSFVFNVLWGHTIRLAYPADATCFLIAILSEVVRYDAVRVLMQGQKKERIGARGREYMESGPRNPSGAWAFTNE